MVDTELVDMTEATSLALTDILYVVVDPSGSKADRKITHANLFKFADGAVILDANGNEILKILKTASAVNEVEIQNGATGSPAVIRASGETNIGLKLTGKGTGKVEIADATDPTKILTIDLSGATTVKTLTLVSSHTDDRTITFPDATDTLVGKATTDTLTNKTLTAPVLTYTINAQTGTTYTPDIDDAKKIVTLSNASAIAVTIPPNSSVAYAVGSSITFIQIGAGQVTINQGSGVTINSTGATPTAPVLRAQYSSCTAIKTATDTWIVVGDIE